jgi:hypothetical protein
MSFSNSITTLFLVLSFTIGKQTSYAVPKKIVLKKDTPLLVFEANTQTTFQGRKESNPMQEFLILAKWQQPFTAEEFYFKYHAIWRIVRIRKISHYNNPSSMPNAAVFSTSYYNAQLLGDEHILKNDSIELYPMPNGRYKIPSFFKQLPNQCIVYVHNNIWYFKTLTFKQLQPVINP